jgi:hypothetical protein
MKRTNPYWLNKSHTGRDSLAEINSAALIFCHHPGGRAEIGEPQAMR